MYDKDEFLMLSGIQHFAFCKKQWALIHIEQQWQENVLTMEGMFLHEKAYTGASPALMGACAKKRGFILLEGTVDHLWIM